mmetsp:Transcript_11731/g.23345  ORF Transcript_11731/g.23345 Transcript_11731/m.23345 type:complete len:151 (-) Transcript_11731:179-631(-)|eukprot:CAMPEP_0182464416 /NCGR_PEP_ID=MMETSP1319-20130603/8619_1 /TAXON_ID=172717 /ORGANISM="Bolidomonas pacifica, Strain RCC208" /LENGTH=150 /DNA_ID=CAMNT_0024664059 /DNA_START=257 /DNA_END=709 /DNA_ORIENTATION=+
MTPSLALLIVLVALLTSSEAYLLRTHTQLSASNTFFPQYRTALHFQPNSPAPEPLAPATTLNFTPHPTSPTKSRFSDLNAVSSPPADEAGLLSPVTVVRLHNNLPGFDPRTSKVVEDFLSRYEAQGPLACVDFLASSDMPVLVQALGSLD